MFKKDELGNFCPILKQECIERKCAWYIKIAGKNPQSEEVWDHYGCAIAWQPILTLETAQQTRQTGASVDKLCGNIQKSNQSATNAVLQVFGALRENYAQRKAQQLSEKPSDKLLKAGNRELDHDAGMD